MKIIVKRYAIVIIDFTKEKLQKKLNYSIYDSWSKKEEKLSF